MNSSPVEPGEILAGKYKVERVLGVGGMGVVVAAMHLQLDQRVALKFLLPEVLDNAEVVARFAREARAAAKIQSEHVARVIDVGTLTTGSPFIVMEYLEGHDLAAELEARRQLPVVDAVTHLLHASEALAEAHAAGIVHRDLKPANLFLARRPGGGSIVKVLDFGISKSTTGPDAALTKTSTLVGSPYYMSPEQLTSSKSVDARSDIWALGVILHELLAGTPPFAAETMPEIVAMILGTAPAPISASRPDVPAELEQIITRCLQRRPADRFANVAELARALGPFGAHTAGVSVDRISRVLGASQLPPVVARTLDMTAPAIPAAGLAATDIAWQHPSTSAIVIPKSRTPLVLAGIGAFGLLAGIAAVVIAAHPTMPTASGMVATTPAAQSAPAPPVTLVPVPDSPQAAPSSMRAKPAPRAPHGPGRVVASPSRPKPGAKPAAATAAAPPAAPVAAPPPAPVAPPPPPPAPEPPKKNPLQIDLK